MAIFEPGSAPPAGHVAAHVTTAEYSDLDALRKDLSSVVETIKGTAKSRAESELDALHKRLKASRYPVTVSVLMEELGCSRATLYRDVEFLRDALRAPIDSHGEQGFL